MTLDNHSFRRLWGPKGTVCSPIGLAVLGLMLLGHCGPSPQGNLAAHYHFRGLTLRMDLTNANRLLTAAGLHRAPEEEHRQEEKRTTWELDSIMFGDQGPLQIYVGHLDRDSVWVSLDIGPSTEGSSITGIRIWYPTADKLVILRTLLARYGAPSGTVTNTGYVWCSSGHLAVPETMTTAIADLPGEWCPPQDDAIAYYVVASKGATSTHVWIEAGQSLRQLDPNY